MCKIVIDLEKIQATEFVDNEIFQQDLLKEISDDIMHIINAGGNYGVSKPAACGRMIYFIHGMRGAGKTSFLNCLSDKLTVSGAKNAGESSDIRLLRKIDPTKIETCENFLVIVIHSLCKMYHDVDKCRSFDEEKTKKMDELMESIARGVDLMNCPSSDQKWCDELMAFYEGQERCLSGMDLADNVKKLIDLVCSRAGCKALLLTIDDADTHIHKAWDVMEACRKYLSVSKLIILITGDMRLYHEVVRNRQFMAFDEKLYRYDDAPARKENRLALIDQLEEQYILKMYPTHCRYALLSLWDLCNVRGGKGNVSVKVTTSRGSDDRNLLEIIENIFKPFASAQMEEKEFFLRLPLRSILQVLYPVLTKCNDASLPDAEEFQRSFMQIFAEELTEGGFDSRSLQQANNHVIYSYVLRHSIKVNDLSTGFYLACRQGSVHDRLRAMIFSSYVSVMVQKSAQAALCYHLLGAGSVTLYRLARMQADMDKPGQDEEQFYKLFCGYMQMESEDNLKHWSRGSCPILLYLRKNNQNAKRFAPGVIRLLKDQEMTFDTQIENCSKNEQSGELDPALYYTHIAMASCVEGNDPANYFSLFNLVTFMIDCASLKLEEEGNTEGNRRIVRRYLKDRETLRHCATPSWQLQDWEEPMGKIDVTKSSDRFGSEKSRKLEEEIIDFHIKMNNIRLEDVTAEKIGQSWNWLYYRLVQIVERTDKSKAAVDKLMLEFKNEYLESVDRISPDCKQIIAQFPLWKTGISNKWKISESTSQKESTKKATKKPNKDSIADKKKNDAEATSQDKKLENVEATMEASSIKDEAGIRHRRR